MRRTLPHRFRAMLGLGLACTLAGPAVAQGDVTDPTENLPHVEAAGLLAAASTCIAASNGDAVEVDRFVQDGWTKVELTGPDGAPLDLPVSFLSRAAGDPLVVIAAGEGAPPACMPMGVIAAGEAAVQATFAEAFGPGQTDGDAAIYMQGANLIALEFEEDDEQGLIARVAVVQPGD